MLRSIVWLQITSGRGPEECCLAVAKLADHIIDEAKKRNIDARFIETVAGDKPGTYRSVLLVINGLHALEFGNHWKGTVQWISKSLYRPYHKRKNWFIGVNILQFNEDSPIWSKEDIRVESMKAKGPGGQHVNKTETAIRVTHIPTGLSTIAQEERSQHLNKKLALARLCNLLEEKEKEDKLKMQKSRWSHHNRLERGNPVHTYEGEEFKLKLF